MHAPTAPVASGPESVFSSPAHARERERRVRGRNQAAEDACQRIALARAEGAAGQIAGEAQAREEQHEQPERPRLEAAERSNGTLRQQGQDDDGHHAEASGSPHLGVVQLRDERVESRFLDEQQRRHGDDTGRERQRSQARGHAGPHDDQRSGLGRRVHVHAAGRHVARDDERDGPGRQDDGEAGEVERDEPAREARDASEQRERADAAKPRARPGRVPGPLAFDADRGAAKSRDDDMQKSGEESVKEGSLTEVHGSRDLSDPVDPLDPLDLPVRVDRSPWPGARGVIGGRALY